MSKKYKTKLKETLSSLTFSFIHDLSIPCISSIFVQIILSNLYIPVHGGTKELHPTFSAMLLPVTPSPSYGKTSQDSMPFPKHGSSCSWEFYVLILLPEPLCSFPEPISFYFSLPRHCSACPAIPALILSLLSPSSLIIRRSKYELLLWVKQFEIKSFA